MLYDTGVASGWFLTDPNALKRYVLLFKHICVVDLPSALRFVRDARKRLLIPEHVLADVEWLCDAGVLKDQPFESLLPPRPVLRIGHLAKGLEWSSKESLFMLGLSGDISDMSAAFDDKARWGFTRVRIGDAVSAVPILASDAPLKKSGNRTWECNALSVVIGSVPVPDETTSWEQILELRAHPDASAKALALRRWLSQLGTKSTPLRELNDELHWRLNEYERHMRIQDMKINTGTVETVLTAAAEVLEDILKFKLKDAVGLLFSARKRKIALAEAEESAPGKEIAYIAHLRRALRAIPQESTQT